MSRHDRDHDHDGGDHDGGLAVDLPALSRRRALGLFGGAGLAALAACGTATRPAASGAASTTAAAAAAAAAAAGEQIPAETAGPFPGDGSNGVNVLTASGIVRSDITSSFGQATAVAGGVPLTIALTVLDSRNGSPPLAGAAVYVWHCDQQGRYSLYDRGIAQENYLRGVQEAAADGTVTFRSVYPAAYSGRWPHIHFEVYPSLVAATTASGKLRTSQLALPQEASAAVYATDGYSASVANLARTSLATDNVFSDGWSLQLATVTGSVTSGLTASLVVPV